MKLRPNVRFSRPVCLAYKYAFLPGCAMQTVCGTDEVLPGAVYFETSYGLESFSSLEECELTAAARGTPFMVLPDDIDWLSEDERVVSFVAKYNPDAVEEGSAA